MIRVTFVSAPDSVPNVDYIVDAETFTDAYAAAKREDDAQHPNEEREAYAVFMVALPVLGGVVEE